MDSESSILSLSLKDLFTSKMLKYSILPFVLSMIIMYILFFVVAGYGLDQLATMSVESTQTTVIDGVPHTDALSATLQGSAIIQFLMSHALTSWIASFLVYTVGSFLTLYLSVFIAIIIIGFMTPLILKEIQRRHYPDVELIGHSGVLESLFLVLKWISIMIVLFIVSTPLYFIPIVNIIAFNFPMYYFFHKMMTHDVSSNICTKEEAIKIKFFNATSIRLKTLGMYLISMIPFVVFFASVFYVIYLGHTYFIYTKKLRAEA